MRVTTIVSLGASAVLGIGALFAAKFWLPDSEKDKVVQTAPVVVAARPIEFGTRLDEKNLAVVQLPVEAAPAGSYRTVKEVIALDGGAPVALTALSPREPFRDQLTGPVYVDAPVEFDIDDREADTRDGADPRDARHAVHGRLDRERDEKLHLLRREALGLGHERHGWPVEVGEDVDRQLTERD